MNNFRLLQDFVQSLVASDFLVFSSSASGSSFSPSTSGFKNKHIAPSEEKYLETNKLFSVLSSPQIRFENHPSEFGFGKKNTHRATRILVVFFAPARRADVLKALSGADAHLGWNWGQ